MNLTEFLEARIAENERAVLVAREWADGQWLGDPSATAVVIGESDGTRLWSTDQLLAECAAKRKIVQYVTGLRLDRARDAETDARYLSSWWIACQLATSYKDHQDYKQEWAL